MKSVGIITIHRLLNYGSALQTVALSSVVTKLGYKCTVIDYLYPNKYHRSQLDIGKRPLKSRVKSGILSLLSLRDNFKKRSKFSKFLSSHLIFTKEYTTKEELIANPPKFDIYITGSDQVWNPKYCHDDTSFLLPFAVTQNKIAYAASFGQNKLSQYYIDKYRNLIKQYKAISVREKSGISLVREIEGGGYFAENVLDPTFLLNKDNWLQLCGEKHIIDQPYILCYILSYSFEPFPWAYQLIDHIQKLTQYKVVLINGSEKFRLKKNYILKNNIGPTEFIDLYANAAFVITSSFHGTAFAINFNRPFLSIVNDQFTSDDRQIQVLTQMGLTRCAISRMDSMPTETCLDVDFTQTNKILEEQREASMSFLKTALQSL